MKKRVQIARNGENIGTPLNRDGLISWLDMVFDGEDEPGENAAIADTVFEGDVGRVFHLGESYTATVEEDSHGQ